MKIGILLFAKRDGPGNLYYFFCNECAQQPHLRGNYYKMWDVYSEHLGVYSQHCHMHDCRRIYNVGGIEPLFRSPMQMPTPEELCQNP